MAKKIDTADLIPGRTFYSQVNPRLHRTVSQVYLDNDTPLVKYRDQVNQAKACSRVSFLEWVNRGPDNV